MARTVSSAFNIGLCLRVQGWKGVFSTGPPLQNAREGMTEDPDEIHIRIRWKPLQLDPVHPIA